MNNCFSFRSLFFCFRFVLIHEHFSQSISFYKFKVKGGAISGGFPIPSPVGNPTFSPYTEILWPLWRSSIVPCFPCRKGPRRVCGEENTPVKSKADLGPVYQPPSLPSLYFLGCCFCKV